MDLLSLVDVERLRPVHGRFPAHSHDEFVISVNGPGVLVESVTLDRARFEVGADDLTVYNPGQVQASSARTQAGTPWECISIHVDPQTAAAVLGGQPAEARRPVVSDPRLAHGLRRAAALHDQQAARELALWVLSEALRQSAREPSNPSALEGPGTEGLRPVLERMRNDLSFPVRVSELAESASLSPDHFIRSFVRTVRLTPYAWHLQLRLREGRRRLRDGEAPAAVAAALGFSDQSHFHRHFRAAYAQTPGAVRRRDR